MEFASFGCKVPGCGGPASGVCINGLSFDECPDVVKFADLPSEVERLQEVETKNAPIEDLMFAGGSNSLDAINCDTLLRRSGGIVVGVVAGPEVGKTTMIATLYELVHRRRMKTIRFAGSETLRGYEERCHLARLASNGCHADTARTPTRAQLSFTHLRLAINGAIKDVIFSDRSGEHFDNALNRPASIASFAELDRADIILLLVDLKQLFDDFHQTLSACRRLFLAMNQHGILNGKRFRLVGTKLDLFDSAHLQDEVNAKFEDLRCDLQRRSKQVEIVSTTIASRAKKSHTEIGDGLEALLNDIMVDNRVVEKLSDVSWPETPTELDKLMHAFRGRNQ